MNCRNERLLSKVSRKKIDEQMELHFSVQDALPDCRRINARDYIELSGEGATATYSRFNVPANRFECFGAQCVNTGTLSVSGGAVVKYRANFNALDFANGAFAFYATGSTLKVAFSNEKAMTNSDVYNVSGLAAGALIGTAVNDTTGAQQMASVNIDLSATPDEVTGKGWEPSEGGVFITITSDADFSVSSMAFYESIDDFVLNDVVSVGCLTSIDGDIEIDAAEETCVDGGGYDTEEFSGIEKTITATKITPNFHKLNPMIKKGSAVKGFDMRTMEVTVGSDGTYTVPDLYQKECGFIVVEINDPCRVEGSKLSRLEVGNVGNVTLDEDKYAVVFNADGSTTFKFNMSLAGKEVVIAYPQEVDVEEYSVGKANINDAKRVRMAHRAYYKGGYTYMKVYNNVLITSFPDSDSNEDSEFEIGINIRQDESGHFYHLYKLLNESRAFPG